ncbi:MAG: tetratricopeptide repeat protein [Chitinophagaceae bacterium]
MTSQILNLEPQTRYASMNRIDTIRELLNDCPDDSFLQHALALEYIKTGNEEDARVLFEQILNREAGYIGSYYHLAKLLERTGQTAEAVRVYEKGMAASKQAGDNHAYNELQSAYEDLIDE